jgi:hypothetical protein
LKQDVNADEELTFEYGESFIVDWFNSFRKFMNNLVKLKRKKNMPNFSRSIQAVQK